LDIAPIGDEVFAKVGRLETMVPLNALGEGMVRVAFYLAMVLSAPEGGVGCFDEIENGLHYSTMDKFWRALVSLATARKVQLIVTTHNLEMLHSVSKTMSELSNHNLTYMRLDRCSDGRVVNTVYDSESLATHLDINAEVR